MTPARLLLPLIIVAALFLAYRIFELPHESRLPLQSDDPGQSRSNRRNELLLRFIEPMEGGTTSFVFTETSVLECEGTSQHDGATGEVIFKTTGCKTSRIKPSRTVLESRLRSFSELAGANASCEGVADGWGIVIEGVHDNERFAFEAWNPNACENADARKLYKLVESTLDQGS